MLSLNFFVSNVGGDIGRYPIPQYHRHNWQMPKYHVENQQNTDTTFMIGTACLKFYSSRVFVYLKHLMWLNIIINSSELASGLLPLQYVTYGAARGELQGSLCTLLLVLLCIVALLTDRSGSIFAYLRIIADSCSLSSLPAWWFGKYFLR